MALDLTLYHNSQTNYNDELGNGWSWSYDIYVNNLSANPIVHWGDGTSVPYSASGGSGGTTSGPTPIGGGTAGGTTSSTYTAPTGIYDSLVKNADSTWTVTKKDGTKYYFNAAGFCYRIQDRKGNAISLTLNSGNYVTRITDPTGRYININVDASGDFQSATDHTGRTWTFVRNTSDDLVQVNFPSLDGQAYGDSYTYNTGHDILTHTDKRGKVWNFSYFTDGSISTESDPLNNTTTYTYGSSYTEVKNPLNGIERHNYSSGVLASVVDEAGFSTSYTTRDANKNPTTVVDKRGKTWRYTFDSKGNQLSVTDPLNGVRSFVYDAYGHTTLTRDALGHEVQIAYDGQGNAVTVTDGLGRVRATNSFDSYGQLTSYTNGSNATWSLEYDLNGNVGAVTDPTGVRVTASYDALGNPLSSRDGMGADTTYVYDAWGRLLSKTEPGGSAWVTTYDAEDHPVVATDSLNHTSRYTFDAAGRPLTITDAKGYVETYGYDAAGNKTSLVNGRGKTTSWTYTPRGERRSVTLPDGATDQWSYDGEGNVTAHTNAQNETVYYGYDDAERKVLVDYPSGTDTVFSFDAADRQTSLVDATGTTTWSFDAANQLTRFASPQGATTYSYDAGARRSGMVDASGTTTYTYDLAGRLATLQNAQSETTRFSYDAAGRPLSQTAANGVVSTFGYDGRSRANSIVHKNSGGTTLAQESYVYDGQGNLTSRTANGVVTSFGYDALDQLISETRTGYAASYTYDGNGNRLSKAVNGSTETYTYDDGDKLLSIALGSATKSFGYDAAGRTTSIRDAGGSTALSYDADGRLTRIVLPNGQVDSFAYNGLDARVSKTDSTGSYAFRRDGALPTDTVLGDGKATYTPGVSERRNGVSSFGHADRLGTLSLETSATQVKLSQIAYDAFGVALSGSKASPFGFAGQYGYQEDPDAGLKLLGRRYYAPQFGRFLTRDPEMIGSNLYEYAGNNPLKYVDPAGEDWRTWGAIGGGIIGGILGGPPGAALGAGLGGAAGSYWGDGDDLGTAIVNGTIDGVLTYVGGKLILKAGAVIGERLAARAAARLFSATTKKLQHIFSGHAGEFGLGGNWNKAIGEQLERILEAIVRSPKSLTRNILFRGKPAKIYIQPGSNLMVVVDQVTGEVIAAWKLSAAQLKYLLTRGTLN